MDLSDSATPTEQQDELRQPHGNPEGAIDYSVELLRQRLDLVNTSPLTNLDQTSIPRTFESLYNDFMNMLNDDFRHHHGRLTCIDVSPVDPDSSH